MADEAAPKSALDAQAQGHVEHAEQVAADAEAAAVAEKARADAAAEKAAAVPAPPAPGEPGPLEKERAQVVVTQVVPPAVPMETTEELRLTGVKAAVVDHLRNAAPDMTGGQGVQPVPADVPTADPPPTTP